MPGLSQEKPTPMWHLLNADATAKELAVDLHSGLSSSEAAHRLKRHGSNTIREQQHRSRLHIFFEHLSDFMIIVLIGAAIISGAVGDLKDSIVILLIVLLNAAMGTFQQYKAEQAIQALRSMATPECRVIRDATPRMVPAALLVPGDLVLIEAGNKIPADLRLIEAVQAKFDESALTGESVPTEKQTATLSDPHSALGDRTNLAYQGTIALSGRAKGIAIATGMRSELGKIATLLTSGSVQEQVRTPLQRRLDQLGHRLSVAVLGICVVLFGAGVLRGEEIVNMFITAISIAVAAIPESLPAVVTIGLALGARRMARHQALVRSLPAVETLGSVTHICTDKTGTLTQNRMQVKELFMDGRTIAASDRMAPKNPNLNRIFQAMALSNDASLAPDGAVTGDPSEVALLALAEHHGFEKRRLSEELPRIAELPFDSTRQAMSTLHSDQNGVTVFCKGSPESIINKCAKLLLSTGEVTINKGELQEAAKRMAFQGLRVLALACRKLKNPVDQVTPDLIEADLTFLALAGIADPPRPEAAASVRACLDAGITPIMITGDHVITAHAIARQLAIADGERSIISGPELAKLPDAELENRVEKLRVYARMNPAQKIRIVMALQNRGEVVAMTGDGVNDAPALKKADIGVAMGKQGTDVAREASHLVLLDDNFATIVVAVAEGRRIYDNIRKFVRYAMTGNSGELWTLVLAPFIGLPIPLIAIQILWVNLITDGLPGLALAVEPAEAQIMKKPPRPIHSSIFADGLWQHVIFVGLLIGAISLWTEAWGIGRGNGHWQTMVFTVLSISQMGHVLAIRSERESLFKIGILSNRPLLLTVIFTLLLQLATIYVPFLNDLLKTQPLTGQELAVCLVISTSVFWAVELEKFLVRKNLLYRK